MKVGGEIGKGRGGGRNRERVEAGGKRLGGINRERERRTENWERVK